MNFLKSSCTQKEVSDCDAIDKEPGTIPGTINDDKFRLIWAIFIELHIQKQCLLVWHQAAMLVNATCQT